MRLELETRRFYLGRDYSEAIEAAGGVPLHICLIPKREFIESVVSQLDGVLLPGSDTDMDPSYYNEEPHPKLGRTIPEKDETDLHVLEAAEKFALPVLAICFGMQSLNVSRGGSLIQDISAQVEDAIKHRQGPPLARESHFVRVASDSRIANYATRGGSEGIKDVKVNSHHHQAVKNVGSNLKATAWARDGVIEAIEDTRGDRFAVGVQWHPELSWQENDVSRSIFEDFVKACSVRMAAARGNSSR